MDELPTVCFVGPLPPPTHGMANMNAQVLKLLSEHVTVASYPVMPTKGRGIWRHITKASRLILALAGLLKSRLQGCRTFYGSVDDGWGGLSTIAIALIARICGYQLYFHHHSFRYVDRKSSLMSLLTKVAGSDACHVMLCDAMDAKFRAQYPAARQTIVVPNIVPHPPTLPTVRERASFTIGMLSNLMFEKGVREFVELLEAGRAASMSISAILAGPAWNAEVERYIVDAIQRNAGKLTWLGPVHGDKKEDFFSQIDLFVFPTRYSSECYPLVIVEALTRGKPVISRDRGCINAMSSESVIIVPKHEKFSDSALSRVQILASKPAEQRLAYALADAAAINAKAQQANERLIDLLRAAPSNPLTDLSQSHELPPSNTSP